MIYWFRCKNCDRTYSVVCVKELVGTCPFCHTLKVERIYIKDRGEKNL